MSVDTKFLNAFVGFLNEAFPPGLSADKTVGRADIMVYGLATKLCSLTGTTVNFLDWAYQGGTGGSGPHKSPPRRDGEVEEGGPAGGSGPHRRSENLVEYAADVSSPELATAPTDVPRGPATMSMLRSSSGFRGPRPSIRTATPSMRISSWPSE
jgi:hypothetical protein